VGGMMLLVGRVGFGLPWPTSLPGVRQRPAVSQVPILSWIPAVYLGQRKCRRPRTFRDAGPPVYRLSGAAMSSQDSETE